MNPIKKPAKGPYNNAIKAKNAYAVSMFVLGIPVGKEPNLPNIIKTAEPIPIATIVLIDSLFFSLFISILEKSIFR